MCIDHDIPYADGEACTLDLHHPQGPGPSPGVMVVHGGGWHTGDKSDLRQTQIAGFLAARGFVVANINYTLPPTRMGLEEKAPYIVQAFRQCQAALAWFRGRADELGLDAERIGTIGGSAGGNMSLMLALCAGDAQQRPIAPPQPVVRAVVNLYGPVTWPAQLKVVDHITSACPPVLTIHGSADTTVPLEQAQILDRALQAVGVSHELIVVDGAPHTFNMISDWGDYSPQVLAHFRRHL